MTTLSTIMTVAITIMCVSTLSFVASEVCQLAVRAQIQSFLMISLSLSLAFLALSLIVSRLSSRQNRNET